MHEYARPCMHGHSFGVTRRCRHARMLLAELPFNVTRALHALRTPIVALLAIELLDELVFGAREAAWPALREELDLSYAQIGVLLSVPTYSSALLEPVFGVLGDSRWRRAVVVGGGIGTTTALALVAGAPGFVVLLVAFALLFPSTGAFVSLSQATLMDLEPQRRELNMTRWSIAGGVGAVAGPLLLILFTAVGAGWRGLFATFALLAVVLTFLAAATHSRVRSHAGLPSPRAAFAALGRPLVARWLVLLEFADLLLDVLLGYVALYLVDQTGASAQVGSLGVAVWTGAGLVGGLGVIALLRRFDGLRYLRASALAALVLYPAFLLVPGTPAKLLLLAVVGVTTAGWYSIPKARLYDALSGQSGAVLTLGSVAGLIAGTFPLAIGLIADRYGIDVALWLLVAGPAVLLVGVPKR
jgi:FSR family fosmidomycin resistance protein-like MFS transporter